MNRKRAAEVLAAHANRLIGRPGGLGQAHMTDQERDQMTDLFRLAERLWKSMPSVRPPQAFVRSLKRELVADAGRQATLPKRARRSILIGAAAVGSVLSVASLVGVIVVLVTRLRARADGRVAPVPTS